MTNRFETDFQGSATDLLEDMFGKSVTYTAYGGSGATVTVRWRPGDSDLNYYPDAEQLSKVGIIRANTADITNIDERDTFTIDGIVWAVDRIIEEYPVLVIQVVTKENKKYTAQQQRINR